MDINENKIQDMILEEKKEEESIFVREEDPSRSFLRSVKVIAIAADYQ